MAVSIPPLTSDQQQELDSIMENTQLLEFMEAHLSKQGEMEQDETILERQACAIEAFSKNPPAFWSLK